MSGKEHQCILNSEIFWRLKELRDPVPTTWSATFHSSFPFSRDNRWVVDFYSFIGCQETCQMMVISLLLLAAGNLQSFLSTSVIVFTLTGSPFKNQYLCSNSVEIPSTVGGEFASTIGILLNKLQGLKALKTFSSDGAGSSHPVARKGAIIGTAWRRATSMILNIFWTNLFYDFGSVKLN